MCNNTKSINTSIAIIVIAVVIDVIHIVVVLALITVVLIVLPQARNRPAPASVPASGGLAGPAYQVSRSVTSGPGRTVQVQVSLLSC